MLRSYIALIIFLCGAALFSGCTTVLSRDYTLRDPEPVDGPLRTDGFYYRVVPPSEKGSRTDVVWIEPLILWTDGTALMNYDWGIGSLDEEGKPSASAQSVEEAVATFKTVVETRGVSGEREVRGTWSGERKVRGTWGAFRIRGDSITIQVVGDYSFDGPATYSTSEYHGVVESDTTFTLTSVTHYVPISIGFFLPFYRTRENTMSRSETYRFHPLDEMPASDNWTKTHPELQ